jgi:hypothetical protein
MKNTWGAHPPAGGRHHRLQLRSVVWAISDVAFSGIKTNLTNIINYVGAVMKNLPQAFKLTLSTVWELPSAHSSGIRTS